ncbi:MAG: hypothetical protein HQL35_11270 [Alphaproteobacteria bacterium]|nr:hypothetical protein [Alphaproteobacteria bacterium]
MTHIATQSTPAYPGMSRVATEHGALELAFGPLTEEDWRMLYGRMAQPRRVRPPLTPRQRATAEGARADARRAFEAELERALAAMPGVQVVNAFA